MNTPNAAVRPQSFANHRAVDPVFLVAGLVLVANVVVQAVRAAREPEASTIWAAVAAAAVVVVWRMSRAKALTVQDRLIRLEMRLRLERVLPPAQRGDIDRLALGQLIPLRFASDAELPALVTAVLAEGVTKRDDIKRRIRDWQADWLRV
jgi:Family of unknown function (DUF6526)